MSDSPSASAAAARAPQHVPPPPGSEKPAVKRPIRENLEAIGIAILMAVLLKPFVIEAYQIPTSSMQPTMMGSEAAGVFDRIIVDKFRPALHDLKRWDITVFRYPIRLRQNYVKRCVGMPNDRLRIAGGNVYQVAPGADGGRPEDLTIERKPDGVQESLWKEVYPFRYDLNQSPNKKALGDYWRARGGDWDESDEGRELRLANASSTATLAYRDRGDGGFCNHLTDGYALDTAALIREREMRGAKFEGVQDGRLTATVVPDPVPELLALEIGVDIQGGKSYRFAFEIAGGKGTLVAEENRNRVAASEPFDITLAAGSATTLAFAHVDDRCLAWVDGTQVATLDTDALKTLVPLEAPNGSVTPKLTVKGGKKLTVRDLQLERDLHYVPSLSNPYTTRVIEIPEDRYLMLGDNTLQSVDSRDWEALTVGVLDDGTLVDPKQHPEARLLIGNRRSRSTEEPVDADENPVVIAGADRIVFEDHLGEVHVLKGRVCTEPGRGYDAQTTWFEDGAGGDPWEPEVTWMPLVRGEDLIGRPLVGFWPWHRIGFFR